jgi:polysaccharide export outer membrane protein
MKLLNNFCNACWNMLVLLVIVGLSACQTQPQVYEQPKDFYQSENEYRLGVGDSLSINVWRNPELSAVMPIRPDGKIALSLVGDIQAAGLSIQELTKNINQALLEYVRNPQVVILLMDSASADFQRRVRVTGAVNAPQSLPFRDGMTVLDLVLIAGGPNDFARSNKAKLYRMTQEGLKVYDIRLDDILEKGRIDTNYRLQPQDIVTVPERYF